MSAVERFTGPDGCEYDTAAEYLWVGVLGGCGCGDVRNPQLAVDVLAYFATDLLARDSAAFTWEYEIVAHWFDSVGLLEHGSSIRGSWLTDKGKTIAAAAGLEVKG